jgi:hypothetical protein
MTLDEKLELLDRRLRYFPDDWFQVDRGLLDMIWGKLDHALAHHRLEVRELRGLHGERREITALGIIRYTVDPDGCRISGEAIKADGNFHPIGHGLPCTRLFWLRNCPIWWLRLAFQTWAPDCTGIDMIDEPLNRPCNLELGTSRLIARRLSYDRRFVSLVEDFDDALGLPPLVRMLVEEEAEANSCDVDRAGEIWRIAEDVTSVVRRVMASIL